MKRRHPNIHNEILMEKRVLHKLNHPGIVPLYCTFQDVGTLYYMNEFLGEDLWTHLHEVLSDQQGDGISRWNALVSAAFLLCSNDIGS